jgi:tRNA uracil 4-sulfurtransferase
MRNIKLKLTGSKKYRISCSQSRFYIVPATDDFDFGTAVQKLVLVPGVVSLSIAYMIKTDIDVLLDSVEEMIAEKMDSASKIVSFKIVTKRGDKKFEYDSQDINIMAGDRLLLKYPDKLQVDLHDPDLIIYIEIRENTYLYTDKITAACGLPVGTGGKAVLLLSGGIDSPVAGYMVSKRGVKIEAVHFHSYPYTSERSRMKVIELAKILSEYNNGLVLHIVSFTEIQQYLKDNCNIEYLTLLMRRIMMRISEHIAEETGCIAIITGESIGQVASQTLESLNTTDNAVNCIVLRPLIAFDKNETVDIAKRIGTFETSILPYEDCCTLFVAKHPKTKPKIKDILEIEAKYDNINELINNAIQQREILTL